MKISIIGAGSIVFTRKLLVDLFSFEEFKEAEIALIDIDPERLEISYRMAIEILTELNLKPKIKKFIKMEDALENSDYVINTVQIGGDEATKIDFDIPEKYGLKQTIADTHGVGGIFRFLRTVPFLKQMVTTMEKMCPDACLVNFTNPMSLCMWYLKSISDIKSFGLCHSVPSTMKKLSKIVNVPYENVDYLIAGINHMAWILEFKYKGRDLYPSLKNAMMDKAVFDDDPVRFEIMDKFDYFVTESSEHMSEYVPYFLKDPGIIKKFNIPVREYLRRLEIHNEVFELYKSYYLEGNKNAKEIGERNYGKYFGVSDGEEIPEELTREYVVDIIHSLEFGTPKVVYAIVRNDGAVGNLPPESMVEIPCLVDGNGMHSIIVGNIPSQLAALNMSQIQVQNLVVDGAIKGDRKKIIQAILLDPLASAILNTDEIKNLTDEMFEAHSKYLLNLFH